MNMLEKYIYKICQCEIKDASGRSNIGINITDALIYSIYLTITVGTLWTVGITTLPFIATVLLIIRSLLKQLRLARTLQKGGNRLAPTYQYRILIYGFLIFFISVVYVLSKDASIGKILLTICYGIFALFEFTDILIDCYAATPIVYKS